MAIPGRGAKSDEAVRREASEWAALIHDGGTPVDRAAFERWRADPRNAEAYARIERNWDRAALVGQTSFGRVRGLPQGRRTFDMAQPRFAFAAVAVLAVAIVGLMIGVPGLRHPFAGSDTSELASKVGEIRKVALADGSSVTLDTDSALRVAYSAGERRLYLSRGRARFDVAHDAARPFIVVAGSGSVVARGTLFDVSVTDGRVMVTLLRGVVDVRSLAARSPSSPATDLAQLRPGQKISFAASAPLPPPQAAAEVDRQWTSGMLTFDNTRLVDAIADANRYSIAKISVADPTLNNLQITGAYHAADTAGLANSLATSFGLVVATTGAGNLVLSRPRDRRAP